MKIQGSTTVALPRAAVWEMLNDPVALSPALPDVESLEVDGTDRWRAVLQPATGLGPSRFAMSFQVLDRQPEEAWTVSAHCYGSEHVVDLAGRATLTEGPDGSTTITWSGDVRLGGVLASVGQRVVFTLIDRHIDAVLQRLSSQVPSRSGGMAT
jgi:hypothetical protein